jgi:hypothetical protein
MEVSIATPVNLARTSYAHARHARTCGRSAYLKTVPKSPHPATIATEHTTDHSTPRLPAAPRPPRPRPTPQLNGAPRNQTPIRRSAARVARFSPPKSVSRQASNPHVPGPQFPWGLPTPHFSIYVSRTATDLRRIARQWPATESRARFCAYQEFDLAAPKPPRSDDCDGLDFRSFWGLSCPRRSRYLTLGGIQLAGDHRRAFS